MDRFSYVITKRKPVVLFIKQFQLAVCHLGVGLAARENGEEEKDTDSAHISNLGYTAAYTQRGQARTVGRP